MPGLAFWDEAQEREPYAEPLPPSPRATQQAGGRVPSCTPTQALAFHLHPSHGNEDTKACLLKAKETSPLCTQSVISVNYAQT